MKQTQTEKFHELLKDFDTAALITHGHETHFRARPMAIARVDDNCDLWFITGEDSAKVHEIQADDPSIVLIHVAGEHGEYWDNTGLNRITYVYQALKAMATGTTPEVKEGEQHGHVDLTHGR